MNEDDALFKVLIAGTCPDPGNWGNECVNRAGFSRDFDGDGNEAYCLWCPSLQYHWDEQVGTQTVRALLPGRCKLKSIFVLVSSRDGGVDAMPMSEPGGS